MSLTATALTIERGSRIVLDRCDIAVEPGVVLGLLGVNGAGKSTLIRALAGQLTGSGEVVVGGRRVSGIPIAERARLIAYVPQSRTIGWPLEVRAVVRLGRSPWNGRGQADPEAERLCAQAMALMDVEWLAERPANKLSGGEQARVLVARAVAQDTPVLLADEPGAGLDPAHQIAMMRAFRTLARQGRAVLVSMHDLNIAARWCDRVVILADGRVAADGAPAEVLNGDTLERLFGIRAAIARDARGISVAPIGLVGDGG